MKRTTAAGGSEKEYDDGAAVVEVGSLSGALSPFESWTRNPASTPKSMKLAWVTHSALISVRRNPREI